MSDAADGSVRTAPGALAPGCGLSQRDRSLISVARLIALNRANELPAELNRALASGISRAELIELVAHITTCAPQETESSEIV